MSRRDGLMVPVLVIASLLVLSCSGAPKGPIALSDFRAYPIVGASTIVDIEGRIANLGPDRVNLTAGSAPFAGGFEVSGTSGCPSPGTSGRTPMGPPLLILGGETVELRIGDGYLTLTRVAMLPEAGSTFDLTLTFEPGGTMTVPVHVEAAQQEELATTGCGG